MLMPHLQRLPAATVLFFLLVLAACSPTLLSGLTATDDAGLRDGRIPSANRAEAISCASAWRPLETAVTKRDHQRVTPALAGGIDRLNRCRLMDHQGIVE